VGLKQRRLERKLNKHLDKAWQKIATKDTIDLVSILNVCAFSLSQATQIYATYGDYESRFQAFSTAQESAELAAIIVDTVLSRLEEKKKSNNEHSTKS
jgi:hypothetical protein